jgi:hypothetical protein
LSISGITGSAGGSIKLAAGSSAGRAFSAGRVRDHDGIRTRSAQKRNGTGWKMAMCAGLLFSAVMNTIAVVGYVDITVVRPPGSTKKVGFNCSNSNFYYISTINPQTDTHVTVRYQIFNYQEWELPRAYPGDPITASLSTVPYTIYPSTGGTYGYCNVPANSSTVYLSTTFYIDGAVPPESPSGLQMAIGAVSNGIVTLGIAWPEDFTNRLDIFATTNLIEDSWSLVQTNIQTIDTPYQWVDTNAADHNERFYITGNADLDSDGDQLSDAREILLYATDPYSPDSDQDGFPDGFEINHGYSATDPQDPDPLSDTDGDGLSIYSEMNHGTNPERSDTDDDGVSDGQEVSQLSDPNDAGDQGKPGKTALLHLNVQSLYPYGNARFELANRGTGQVHLYQSPGMPEVGQYNFILNRGSRYTLSVSVENVTIADDYYGCDLTLTPTNGTFVNGAANAVRNLYLIKKNSPLEFDVFVPHSSITPDYNRDGMIGPVDEALGGCGMPYRFWINDDDDHPGSEVYGDDIPTRSSRDCDDHYVDGLRDLIDFFPVCIRLDEMLSDTSRYSYHLTHEDMALNIVCTELNASNAGLYLKHVETAQALSDATAEFIFPDLGTPGYEGTDLLDPAFLAAIASNHQAVVLVEGSDPSTEPLIFEVRNKSTGNVVASAECNLSLSGVEEMFRHVNLVDDLDAAEAQPVVVPDRTGEPRNFPDRLSNGENFVFVHGYNSDQDAARGWHAEMFKRLYWSRCNAKFTGVTWHGDTGSNYHKAVINAMVTSERLASQLSFLTGEVTIGAHSLGNMLVSEAIANNGFSPERYFMLNAAVPIEAYDQSQSTGQDGIIMQDNMCHPDWIEYDSRLWASEWHALFPGDNRRLLTWNNRFASVDSSTEVYNFFSVGEDIVKNADGQVPSLIGDVYLKDGTYAWAMQEMIKGLDGPLDLVAYNLVMPDQHAGWQFNSDAYDGNAFLPFHQRMTPAKADLITDEELREEPFFERFITAGKGEAVRFTPYDGEALFAPLGDPVANTQALQNDTQYKLLAEAIPAMSFAAAANEISSLDSIESSRNIHMQSLQNGWPPARSNSDWKHSDLKHIAFPYICEFYERVVQEGGLN